MVCSRTSRRAGNRRRGFVLIALCATLFLLMGMIGLAFDIGRVYVAKNEAQIFTDAAALTAAMKLDGTATGVANARAAVAKLPGRWNFGTAKFEGLRVEFSADGEHWSAQPDDAASLKLVRVAAPANPVGIAFLRAAGTPDRMNVAAQSVASNAPVRLVE